MTVLAAIQRAAAVIGLDIPATVFGSTEREHVELTYIVKEAARFIQQAYDWQALKVLAQVAGNGATEDFDLPGDYAAQLQKASVWSSSQPGRPLEHVLDSDAWLGIVLSGLNISSGQWTIYGNQIHIRPALATGAVASYFYISKYIAVSSLGAPQTSFILDTDDSILGSKGEQLLRLAIVWMWKANKGLPYAEDLKNYEIAMANEIARDKGSKILIVGQQRYSGGVDREYAFPGTIVP